MLEILVLQFETKDILYPQLKKILDNRNAKKQLMILSDTSQASYIQDDTAYSDIEADFELQNRQ